VQEAWVRGIRLLPRFAWGSALRTWLDDWEAIRARARGGDARSPVIALP